MANQIITQTPSVTVNGVVSPQPNDSNGVINYASGGFSTDTGTAAALTIAVGFTPRKVKLFDLTALIEYDVYDQMAANNCLVSAATTVTLDTTGKLVVNSDTNNGANGRSFTIAATVFTTGTAKNFVWEAWA